MGRTIPQIRDRLHELSVQHNLPELAELAEETRRQYHGRRAPTQAQAVTEDLVEDVKKFAAAHPKTPQREIGQRFGIDGGRVSEILFGKRLGPTE